MESVRCLMSVSSSYRNFRTVCKPSSSIIGKQTVKRSYSSNAGGLTVFPSVSRLLHEYSLKIDQFKNLGSGPKGRITKGDVLQFISKQNLKPSPKPFPEYSSSQTSQTSFAAKDATVIAASPLRRFTRGRTGVGSFVDQETDNMRRVIADRLTISKTTVPHGYITSEIEIDALSALRKKLNDQLEEKLSVTDFLVRASALSLKRVPEANSQWDNTSNSVKLLKNIDISLAVALDSGLITPIIHAADQKGLLLTSSTAKELVNLARSKQLKPHQYQGGTFSISNLGMFGITQFSAVINPPQAMILAVGGPVPKVKSQADQNQNIAHKSVNTMKVTLSFDTRAVTEDTAAKWLDTFKEYLQNPSSLML